MLIHRNSYCNNWHRLTYITTPPYLTGRHLLAERDVVNIMLKQNYVAHKSKLVLLIFYLAQESYLMCNASSLLFFVNSYLLPYHYNFFSSFLRQPLTASLSLLSFFGKIVKALSTYNFYYVLQIKLESL